MQRTRTPRHRGTSRRLPKVSNKARVKAVKLPKLPGSTSDKPKVPVSPVSKVNVPLAHKGVGIRENLLKVPTNKTGSIKVKKTPKLKPVTKIKTTDTKITGSIKALKQKAKNRKATNKRFENEK